MSTTDHKGEACLCHTAHECQDIHERYTAQRDALRAVMGAFAYAPGRGPEWYEHARRALAGEVPK